MPPTALTSCRRPELTTGTAAVSLAVLLAASFCRSLQFSGLNTLGLAGVSNEAKPRARSPPATGSPTGR